MRVWKRLAILLIATGISTSLFAQGIRATTGNLYGKITDETGGVLPGVTVTLSGVGAPRIVTTDSQGGFRYVNIDPGTYSVRADLAGFGSVDQSKVIVSTGSNTEISITMKVSSVAATVTVTSESPLLDTRKGRTGSNFSSDELANIPTSRDPWGMLQMSAGVLTDNVITGANNNGQQSVFIGKGTNFTNNAWNIDGIPATDLAAVGASPAYYDFDAFQEMQFTTGGSDPSVVVPGVTLNLITKRGTNTPHGSARVFQTPNQTEAHNDNEELTAQGLTAPRINNIQDYGAEVGGAAWKDRLWLWGSYGNTNVKKFKSNGLPDNTVLEDYNGKANAQLWDSNALTGFYFYGNKVKLGRLPSGSQSQHPLGTNWNQDGPSHFEKIEDSQIFGSNFFFTASYSYANTPFNLRPEGGVDAEVNRDAARVWHNSYYTDTNYRPQHATQGTGSYFFNTGQLGNEIKFGGTYITYAQKHTRFWPGDGVYTDNQTIASHNPAYPFTANITRADHDGENVTSIGAYFGDTITAGDLTLNLGVRYDRFYGTNSPSTSPANPAFPNILPALAYPGGTTDFHATTWSPRIGLTYALGAQKTTLLRASYSQFADQGGTSLVAANNPLGAVARAQYQWNGHFSGGNGHITAADICLTCPVNPIGYDPNDPGAAFSPNQIDPNLKAPKTMEITGGVEHQISPEFVAGLTYTYRKRTNFVENCPLALDNSAACISASDYRVFNTGETGYDHNGNPVQTGAFFYVPNIPASYSYGTFETNQPGYSTSYNGVTLQATKRLTNKWMMQGSFTYNDWKQKISSVAAGLCGSHEPGGRRLELLQQLPLDRQHVRQRRHRLRLQRRDVDQRQVRLLGQRPLPAALELQRFGERLRAPGLPHSVLRRGFRPGRPGQPVPRGGHGVFSPSGERLRGGSRGSKVIPLGGTADMTLSINMFNAFNTKTILFRESDATNDGTNHGAAGSADNQQNPRVFSSALA